MNSTKIKKDLRIKAYIESLDIQDPMNVRDCYFGGRTNGLIIHKTLTDGEKGYYVDFTSLYPDILKYRKFPTGHPERITDNFQGCYMKPCTGDCVYDNCQGFHWALPYFGIMKATFKPATLPICYTQCYH